MCNAKCNALSAANAKAWISHFSLHAAHMAGMKIEESLAAEPCYFPTMSEIRLDNVPQDVLDQLQAIAERDGCSVRDIILLAIERDFDLRDHAQFIDELFAHPTGARTTRQEMQSLFDEMRVERDDR